MPGFLTGLMLFDFDKLPEDTVLVVGDRPPGKGEVACQFVQEWFTQVDEKDTVSHADELIKLAFPKFDKQKHIAWFSKFEDEDDPAIKGVLTIMERL